MSAERTKTTATRGVPPARRADGIQRAAETLSRRVDAAQGAPANVPRRAAGGQGTPDAALIEANESATTRRSLHAGDHSFRHSYTKDRAQLLRRLSRLEGQVRGVARMIERDEYCIDILQQTAALRAAIDSVSLLILEDHVAGCLRTAVSTGDAESYTEEVMDVVRRSLGRPVRGSRPSAD